MITIPPRDPNETADPAAEALGKLYEQFTSVQNLAEFHTALRKRDALYDSQHLEMSDNPAGYENLHPKDFFNQFHRRADEDDKSVVAEAPYRIRQQLRDALAAERDTALDRARETYKQLFINRQLAQLDEDRVYYLGKMADAANDQDRERYLTALIGRLKLSGDVGLLYKEDADRLIENIPSDYDIFSFNREAAADPAWAQRLLLYGAYPNIRPALREDLLTQVTSGPQLTDQDSTGSSPLQTIGSAAEDNSETNKESSGPSNEQDEAQPGSQENGVAEDNTNSQASGEQYAAATGQRGPGRPGASNQPQKPPTVPIQKFTQPIVDWRGRKISADDLNRATAVVYGEMTGSDDINNKRTFKRIDKATGTEFETTMTKLGQAGDAYGEAAVLWNRLENPGDYALAGQPKPKNLRDIILSKDQFDSVRRERYKEALSGNVSDPQAYKLAREAVDYTARYGPIFNFDSNRASRITGSSDYRDLEQAHVNMGSGNDFSRARKP